MKISTNTLWTAVLAICAVLSSCDDIKQEDRFIELPAIEANRVVLLEEFTGQKCVNCPEAHEVVKDLLQQYPDNLVAVSIHGGGDAWSYSEEQFPAFGLRNEDGQKYSEENNITSFPSGVINRSGSVLTKDQWAAAIRSQFTDHAKLDIELSATLSEDGSAIEIVSELSPYSNIDGAYQLWLVEDSIISIQHMADNTISTNYPHNHVLRSAINGHNGESVNLVTRESKHLNHNFSLRDSWVKENLSVVAFVYDRSGVLQVAKAKVK